VSPVQIWVLAFPHISSAPQSDGVVGFTLVCVPVARPLDPFGADAAGNRVFNNADSFAQAFDEAWQEHERQQPLHGLDRDSKRALILAQLEDHPFHQSAPEIARQVAEFRLRLLGL
jgi:hypothetical protein